MNASPGESALRRSRKDRLNRGEIGPVGMFFRGFLRHPVMVGSIIPSTAKLAEHMLQNVDWAKTRLFVEYGPGIGNFCPHVLRRLPADATYIAIDTNPDFIAYLRRRITDSRFVAVEGSAADVRSIVSDHGFEHADYILSGMPLSTLPPGVGPRIAAETHAVLRSGGAFLVYQYNPKCRSLMAPHFERIDHEMEWVNIPPAQLYWAWKD